MFISKTNRSQSLKERADKIRDVFTRAYQDMDLLIEDQERLNAELENKIEEIKKEQTQVKEQINANTKFLTKLKDFVA